MNPTQAQIEAALKEWNATHQKLHRGDIKQIAALTATAGVGEQIPVIGHESERWQAVANQGIQIEMQLRKELLTIEAATIERCAQVFKSSDLWDKAYAILSRYDPNDDNTSASGTLNEIIEVFAAAIRALKEEK